MTVQGVGSRKTERENIIKFDKNIITNTNLDLLPEASNNNPLERFSESFKNYITSVFSFETLTSRIFLITNNLSFYLRSFIGLNNFWLVYPNYDLDSLFPYISVYFFLLFMYYSLKSKIKKYFIFLYLTLLPISGLFYVPYFKFSPIADHYIYPALPILAIILTMILNKIPLLNIRKFAMALILIITMTQTVLYIFNYSDIIGFFKKNIAVKNSSTILYEYVAEIQKTNNSSESFKFAAQALEISPNRIDLIRFLQYLSFKNSNFEVLYLLNTKISDIYLSKKDFNYLYAHLEKTFKHHNPDIKSLIPLISSMIVLNKDENEIQKNYDIATK